MVADQQYSRVPESEDQDYLISKNEDGTHLNTPPTFWKRRSFIIALAFGALLIAILTGVAARTSTRPTSTSSSTDDSSAFVEATTSTTHETPKPSSPVDDAASIDLHNTTAPATDAGSTLDLANSTLADPPTLEILDCGSNPAEAREKGCVYDVMMQLWTPAPCYDAALSERFLSEGSWTWWADAGATHVYSDEVIALGEHDVVYVSPDYHKTHCIFSWEKLVRALRNQKPIIEQLISYDHTIHCRHKALAAEDSHGAIAPTGFTRCAMYEVWKQALPPNKFSSVDK